MAPLIISVQQKNIQQRARCICPVRPMGYAELMSRRQHFRAPGPIPLDDDPLKDLSELFVGLPIVPDILFHDVLVQI